MQEARRDLFAMLGSSTLPVNIPSFFHTLSSGDLCWPHLYHMIDSSLVDTNMKWTREVSPQERAALLAQNPVLAVKHFYERFHLYVKHIVKGKSKPFGNVVDIWYRFEFQARGSVHAHGFLFCREFGSSMQHFRDVESDDPLKQQAARAGIARMEAYLHALLKVPAKARGAGEPSPQSALH